MLITIGVAASLIAIIAVYLLFGAKMTARQKTWLPAATALVNGLEEPSSSPSGSNEKPVSA